MSDIRAHWDNSKGLCAQVGKTGRIFTCVTATQLIKLCAGREKLRGEERQRIIDRKKHRVRS